MMLKRTLAAISMVAAISSSAFAETVKIPFALDWKFEGPSAPFFLATDLGIFEEAGFEVDVVAGAGSTNAIPKVASGAFPFGFGDINSIIKFLDQNPGAPVKSVMMVYDKPPFAIIGRKSLGIETPSDLEGKTLGAPPPDAAWAQFPAFAKAAGFDASKVKIETVGFPTREPMLVEENVDAVAGFSFSSTLNLIRLGVPEEDISVLLMADHGLDLYGNTIMVNTDFADENPELVKKFVAAVAKGWIAAINDPEAATAALVKRNPAADPALEQKRLQFALDANVVTDYVVENGMGGIDTGRLERSLVQLAETYEFKTEPDASVYFDSSFLPEGNFPLK